MTDLNVSEARNILRELVDKVLYQGERVTLIRYGRPSAVLVSVQDAELLEMLEDKADLEAISKVLKNPKPVPWEQAKTQIGL